PRTGRVRGKESRELGRRAHRLASRAGRRGAMRADLGSKTRQFFSRPQRVKGGRKNWDEDETKATNNTPQERRNNRRTLLITGGKLGCRPTFMRNPSFPLSVQTAFVEDLTHLRSVRGILEVVTLAGSAESEDQARFLADALDVLARYNDTQSPLAKIIVKGTIMGRDRAGLLIVPVEADYVVWTKRAAYFANRSDLATPKRGIWLSGRMSPIATKRFESLGWVIKENTQLQ